MDGGSGIGHRSHRPLAGGLSTGADLKTRTKAYALAVIRLMESLPSGRTADIIGRQLIRAATSVGANYRAAGRAKSVADFIAKMGIVEEEADECLYWLELLSETKLLSSDRITPLLYEGSEILAMVVASIRTARNRIRSATPKTKQTQ